MPQGIDRQMHLAALAALVTVVPRSRATFTTGLEGSPLENGRAGLTFSTLGGAQYGAQILHDSFEAPSL